MSGPARPTTLERAFQLARSGACQDIGALRRELAAEGYAQAQITGPSLLRQLRALCTASRPD